MALGCDLPKNANTCPALLPPLRPSAALLIGATCLGSGIALAIARQALLQLAPPLNPSSSTAALEAARYRDVDPQRRRDAALLLSAQPERSAGERQRLLQGQGWGQSPLAAVVLKQAAQSAAAQGKPQQAQALWNDLLRRFPQEAASADALYALGQRQRLLQHFPAHPAALAAAVEAGDSLHLARWGARWPGAEALLLAQCQPPSAPHTTPAQRQQLASGLLQLGHLEAAQRCLGTQPLPPELALSLSRGLLRGNATQQQQGQQLLFNLAKGQPNSSIGREATTLLAEEPGQPALQLLEQLPSSLKNSAPLQARLALERRLPWQGVLQRWPQEPSSWELQWQLARQALLKRDWPQASAILGAINSEKLPAALAARQLFWQGYSAQQQGQPSAAQQFWQNLLRVQPVGYYSWRALVQLGRELPSPSQRPKDQAAELLWQPLASGNPGLDELWRTGQALEAWESWRHRRGGAPPHGPDQLLLEGRLRTGIGDDWTGLGQLEFANLRLPQAGCRIQWQRELQQHPRRFLQELGQAAREEGVDLELLWGVARQESRFSPGVASPVGAIGLMQLMPETAAELAGRQPSSEELQNPALNAQLGARYLKQLLQRWGNQPFLSVASYNAGPGAVEGWLTGTLPDPQREPELWTEAIPYPETRLYVKKVLGNRWSYQLLEADPEQLCPRD
jgi:soluble lytic murein transglycosylase